MTLCSSILAVTRLPCMPSYAFQISTPASERDRSFIHSFTLSRMPLNVVANAVASQVALAVETRASPHSSVSRNFLSDPSNTATMKYVRTIFLVYGALTLPHCSYADWRAVTATTNLSVRPFVTCKIKLPHTDSPITSVFPAEHLLSIIQHTL